MARVGLTALAAPADFIALGNVATFARQRYAQVLWIRLQIADADPGAMLVTLLGAAARLDAEASQGMAEMAAGRARMGEWGLAYQLLADWLVTATAPPALLVLEGAEHLDTANATTLDLLVSAFLPHLAGSIDVLLICSMDWDSRHLEPHGQVLGRSRLRLDRRSAQHLAEALLPDLPASIFDHSFALTCGGAGALQAAFSAGQALGPEVFRAVTAQASDGQELLSALGRHLLAGADQHGLISLAVASRLGVWHPAMANALGHSASQRNEPWWLDLEEGWRQLIPAWRAPLRSAGGALALAPASLTLLADYSASLGARDRAFELYLEAQQIGRAADTAVSLARDLAGAGCWATLAVLANTLARNPSTAGRIREPDDPSKHSAHRLRSLFVRVTGQFSSWTGGTQRALPRLSPEARPVHTLYALPQAPALLSAHGVVESRAQPEAMRTTAHNATPDLTAHLLGELRVAIHDRPVEIWASGRGRAVFEYLLVHRHSKVRRDRLMSVFWPEASADAARNSLNVAIHGLRQSLRAVVGDAPVVIYQHQAYFIEPTLKIWVDVEVFEEQLKAAHHHLATAELVKAEAAFEAATCLYKGGFLSDDPYEEWAVVTREHLRLRYLDALDRLGSLRLNSGDYVGCIAACLKLLDSDSCREDAHCRLMRCYSRQGQIQLALRQYHSCVAALRRELDVAPAPATTELFDCLRRRQII